MRREECRVGMRVLCVSEMDGNRAFGGLTGTVVELRSEYEEYEVGVEFDQECGGHVCNGNAKDGHGYYGFFEEIESIEEDLPKELISFDQFMEDDQNEKG